MAEAEEVVKVLCLDGVGRNGGNGGKVAIEGKPERATDCRNTADDVGAVDGGGVPGVSGAVDSLAADLAVAETLVDGDGDGFV